MEILDGIAPRLWALSPWLLLGFGVSYALQFAYRQLRWQRLMAGLARTFRLDTLDGGSSILSSLRAKPGLHGTFHGQAIRLTVEPRRQYRERITFLTTTTLRLRVAPFLSADLRAERARARFFLDSAGLKDPWLVDGELDGLLRITGSEETLDHAVLNRPRVREALAAVLGTCDEWAFVGGELQLRKHSSFFGLVKDVRALLELSEDLADVLTSEEIARVLREDPERASVWSA